MNGKIRTYEKKIGSLMTEVGSLKNAVGVALCCKHQHSITESK